MKKRALAAAVLVLVAALFSVQALIAELVLNAGMPVDDQVQAFRVYLDELDSDSQAQWVVHLREIIAEADDAALQLTLLSGDTLVYIAPTGQVYHRTQSCSGLSNAKNVEAVTEEKAVVMGRRKCKKCY